MSELISSDVTGSSPVVGSSYSIIIGSTTIVARQAYPLAHSARELRRHFIQRIRQPTCSKASFTLSPVLFAKGPFSFWRRGNSKFWRTVMESYSAPLWKRNPIFFLNVPNCSVLSAFTSSQARLLFHYRSSAAERCIVSIPIFPSPIFQAPPGFSPLKSRKVTFFNTSWSPNDFLRSCISMTGSTLFVFDEDAIWPSVWIEFILSQCP